MMGHPRTWKVYDIGNVVGNSEITEVLQVGKRRADTHYRIRLKCCGASQERTHAWIADHASTLRCLRCSNALNNAGRKNVNQSFNGASVVYACGMIWRSLGPLGFRAGAAYDEGRQ